jgi:hypothetical protein
LLSLLKKLTIDILRSCHILAPIPTPLSRRCFKKCIHPAKFEHAITLFLHKSGKPVEDFKNYRPIDLLSILDKTFEQVIASRFKSLAEKHKLLPMLQFGAPLRNTTKTLQYLLYPVYRGWCAGTSP